MKELNTHFCPGPELDLDQPGGQKGNTFTFRAVRVWLWLLVIGLVLIVQIANAANIDMRFIVTSDGHYNYTGNPQDTDNFFTDLTNWSNNEYNSSLGLNYVFFNGDIVDNMKNTTNFTKDMLTVRDSHFSHLLSPYYAIAGNHDTKDDYDTGILKVNSSQWQSIWGYPTDYSFFSGNYAFILMNSSVVNTTYLQSELTTYSTKKVFVFIHIPQTKYTAFDVNNTAFQQVIANNSNVVAVINGHDHDQNICNYENGAYRCWDTHFGNNWGLPYQGYRVFEAFDDGSVLTYTYDGTNQLIVDENVIRPIDIYQSNNTDLQYYLKFDTNLNDSSGNNNNASGWSGGGQTSYNTGKYNQAKIFDPINLNYINTTNYTIGTGINQFTAEFWVKQANNSGNSQMIIAKHNVGSSYYIGAPWTNTANIRFIVTNAASSRVDLNAALPYSIQDNIFHYIVATYNGSYMSLYLDGTFLSSIAQTGDIKTSPTESVLIGNYGALPVVNYCNCTLDEIKIYTRSKNSSEILNDYKANRYSQLSPGIYNGWRLDNKVYSNGTVLYNRDLNINTDYIISNLSVVPLSDLVNVSISTWNTTGDYYKKFNATGSVSTNFTIGDLAQSTSYNILVNRSTWSTNTSNSTGYLPTFGYTLAGETQFEIESALDGDANQFWVRTDGSDSCNGQNNMSVSANATDCAWPTIQIAANNLTPGQKVRVQVGTYNEAITPLNSGTSGSWITYTADGVVIINTPGDAFNLANDNYIVIDGFQLQGNENGIWIDASAGVPSSHVNILNVKVNGSANDAIAVRSGSHDVKITNANVSYFGNHGILAYTDVYNFTINNSVIRDGSNHNAIDIHTNISNVVLENNTVYNIGGAQTAFYLHNNDIKNLLARNNTMYNVGHGFQLIGLQDSTIENNNISALGYGITSDPQVTVGESNNSNITIRNNVVWQTGSGNSCFYVRNLASSRDNRNITWQNNTGLNCAAGGTQPYEIEGDGVKDTIRIIDLVPNAGSMTLLRKTSPSLTNSSLEFTTGRIFTEDDATTAFWSASMSNISIAGASGTVTYIIYNSTLNTTGNVTVTSFNATDMVLDFYGRNVSRVNFSISSLDNPSNLDIRINNPISANYSLYNWNGSLVLGNQSGTSVYFNSNLGAGTYYILESSSDSIDSIPPASLTNASTATWNFGVNNTWANPADADFDHVWFRYANGSTVQNVSTPTSYLNLTSSPHSTQNISAQTVDATGNTNSTRVWFNTTIPNNAPSAPTMTSDLTLNVINHTPTVTFTKGTDVDGDTVVTYVYVDGTNPPTTEETSNTGVSAVIGSTTSLIDGQTYYIRLRSWDGTEWSTGYSSIDTFRMNSKPGIPSLYIPLNNSNLTSNPVTLTWNQSTDAEGDVISYDWKVNESVQAAGVFYNSTTYTSLNGSHNWSVRSYDGYEYSPWADVFLFNMTANQSANEFLFVFSNKALSETQIYQSSQSTRISVDVNDSDGSISDVTVGITFLGVEFNYSMTKQSGDSWSYDFISGVPGNYIVSNFYATDNDGGTNFSSSSLAFTVVSTPGGGMPGSGDGSMITPVQTAVPTPVPTSKMVERPVVPEKSFVDWLNLGNIKFVAYNADAEKLKEDPFWKLVFLIRSMDPKTRGILMLLGIGLVVSLYQPKKRRN